VDDPAPRSTGSGARRVQHRGFDNGWGEITYGDHYSDAGAPMQEGLTAQDLVEVALSLVVILPTDVSQGAISIT